jgi:hypothetical protein
MGARVPFSNGNAKAELNEEGKRHQICVRISSRPVLMWKMWRARQLWRMRSHETLDSCGCGHAFHIIHPLCIGKFALPVGDVGNRGSVLEGEAGFSKTPDLHNRDLENHAGR